MFLIVKAALFDASSRTCEGDSVRVENNLRNGDEKITIKSIVNVSIKSKLGNENPDQNDIANKTVSSKSKFSQIE